MKIKSIHAREILDSRSNPTIQVTVEVGKGIVGEAAVPSGASTGTHEALELRDGDARRYNGKGVLKACENVNTKISKLLKGKNVIDQQLIDRSMIELDGTENKSRLGANAILGVSLACARAAAKAEEVSLYRYINKSFKFPSSSLKKLPTPMFNILNGGKHADSGLDIQEFMIIPVQGNSFSKKVRIGSEIFNALKEILKANNYAVGVGDEGGYAPKLENNAQAMEFIIKAIEKASYVSGKDVRIGIDAAASEFYNKDGQYVLTMPVASLSDEQMIAFYNEWLSRYPLISIEDGLYEDDWKGWNKLKTEINNPDALIVGDDLLVTNVGRLEKAIEEDCANAVIVKPNQIGTLTETAAFIKKARESDWKIIVSHRSGETHDSFISDLAVGVGADFIKSGAPSRGERVIKYNRLMEIEEELG